MVKKSKAKSRLDKFYHLAKDQGYRSRAAFKLIQLNKKFDFLSSAHCVVDLCAAPGGWLQVAANNMPVSSLIVGVDLVPIKPIKGVTTFVGDITTQECTTRIRSELQNHKADVVMHDGAPNVGTNWEQDAYTQNELVLKSLKLATKVLRKDGFFITKIFRSVDYNSLLWVFNKLFGKVNATKPVASRQASAEIFVVCQKYKAPHTIDPKLLDPKYVFMESEDIIEKHNIKSLSQLAPAKEQKRKPIDESRGLSQFRKGTLCQFVECTNPFQFLADYDQLTYTDPESEEYLKAQEPPKDMLEYCKDIRVLGKNELKVLIKWRHKIIRLLEKTQEKIEAQVKPEKNSDEELEELVQKVERKEKRKRKKEKEQEKKRKKSKVPLEIENNESELFTIQDPTLKNQNLEEMDYTDPEDSEEEVYYEEDEGLEFEDEELINNIEETLVTSKPKKAQKKKETEEDKLKEIVEQSMKKEEASRWFQRQEFGDLEDFQEQEQPKKKKNRKEREKEKKEPKASFEVVPQEHPEQDDPEALAETIALGKAMLRKKRRSDIVNYTYNRYSFNDPEDLPDWFTEDQEANYKAPLPVTSEELRAARKEVEAYNKRPIKKVVEAINRRKRRLANKLEKLKPQAEAIANQSDVAEHIKVKQMQKLYKKEIDKNKPKKKYIVSRNVHKGKYKGKSGRHVKFVDKRLKKDKRALKRK